MALKAKALWSSNVDFATEAMYDQKQVLADYRNYYGGTSSYGHNNGTTYKYWSTLVALEGERYAVWDSNGQMKIVDGPARVSLYKSRYQLLTLYSANPSQYLVVEFKDGSRKHIQGPSSLWFDPSSHKSVSMGTCYTLDTNEVIVVYNKQGDKAMRKTISGPALYMPEIGEWVHKFNWGNKSDSNQHHAFSKLQTAPDTMDVEVQFVRTADDGHLDLNLMVFFQLVDINKMLDNTQDPISDLTNAIVSDVVLAISKHTFPEFKANTERLNDLKRYAQAVEQAGRIGYRIDRIVFKGYQAGEALQKMQTQGIQSRTKLQLEQEQEMQNQRLKDFVLEKDQERSAKKQALEMEELANRNKLRELQALQEQKEKEAAMKFELRAIDLKHAQEIAFLKGMKDMGVNLTPVLVAQATAEKQAAKAISAK